MTTKNLDREERLVAELEAVLEPLDAEYGVDLALAMIAIATRRLVEARGPEAAMGPLAKAFGLASCARPRGVSIN